MAPTYDDTGGADIDDMLAGAEMTEMSEAERKKKIKATFSKAGFDLNVQRSVWAAAAVC